MTLMQPISMKLVIVGDGAVGKTSMLLRYSQNRFSREYEPTIFQNSIISVKVDSKIINLGLWDTAGQEEFAKIRPLAYTNVDIFLIVFSVVDKISLNNAVNKWYPEVHSVCPKAVKIFVGNKIDLRNKPFVGGHIIQTDEAQSVIKKLSYPFRQCSALTRQGLTDTFQKAVIQVLKCSSKAEDCCPGCKLI